MATPTKTDTSTLLTLKEAASAHGIPVKRLRRWIRYHKLGRPIRDDSGHYLVDPAKLGRYMELVSKVRELRDIMEED